MDTNLGGLLEREVSAGSDVALSATPAWADFPTDEYHARLAGVQRAMHGSGIDLLILTKRENVHYFSGFQSGHWAVQKFATAILLVPASKDPVLVIPEYFAGTARGSSWVTQHAYLAEPHARPRAVADVVVSTIRGLAGSSPVIGLELGENLVSSWNLADYHAVRDQLAGATFTSAAEVLWACRMIKSPGEIDRLRTIVRVTEQALIATRGELHVGMTEAEIAQALAAHAFRAGADGVALSNVRCGLDRYGMADGLPTDRPIGLTEMLVLHPGFYRRSYVSELSHNTHVGQPTARHHGAWATIVRAQEAMLATIRPGVRAGDVFVAGNRVLAEMGFGRPSQYCGHGIGVDVVEPPYLAAAGDHLLAPGMVLALEPWVSDIQGLGIFGLGEMAAVTEDGYDLLTTLPREELWSTNA